MLIGKVVGNVWATRKDESLNGLKFLIIQQIDYYLDKEFPTFVAIDTIGAGIGETVLVSKGSSARKIIGKSDVPIDASVIGIIDTIEVEKAFKER
ncbi:Carbon dioxide concentrating mechanism protein CcmL [Caloramator mitchellensis]|uniref:Carbon dioxide concentrating mechanism protein CcmL n=1 Tax=Caloramator mitchellensis TaxID=908809 RepID=A0A0R3JSL8_CALMK|nr:EutN/CcmL family microcompartment protein [Caloramator mitchellensis]KRQ86497.1 Carbon dioxide concentrating mechanism protein CcmL [Caloramator mitchellensis]